MFTNPVDIDVTRLRGELSPAPSHVLYRAASVMISVLPARLRDSRLAVQYAERLVTSSHRLDPNSLPILAQAYLEDGQLEEADRTVREGLSHLAPQRPGTPVVRCRVLLKHTLATILNRQNNQQSGKRSGNNTPRHGHP